MSTAISAVTQENSRGKYIIGLFVRNSLWLVVVVSILFILLRLYKKNDEAENAKTVNFSFLRVNPIALFTAGLFTLLCVIMSLSLRIPTFYTSLSSVARFNPSGNNMLFKTVISYALSTGCMLLNAAVGLWMMHTGYGTRKKVNSDA